MKEIESWRRLDNTAKLFSLDDINNTSIFRYSAVFKDEINFDVLHKALMKTLDDYPSFRVRIGTGLFWNYLEYNFKEPIVSIEEEIPCKHIDFKNNNDYLFRVTYYKKKINLDIFHVLTDGNGALVFFKALICHYIGIRYNTRYRKSRYMNIGYTDNTLKYYKKRYYRPKKIKPTFKIKGRVNRNVNNTYHYILSVKEVKSICKKLGVTVTEYLTSIYMYAMYLSIYDKKSNKELNVIVPINLRKHFDDDTLANFFTYMNIYSNFRNKKNVTFESVLKQVKKEFKEKYTDRKIKQYLASDVSIGINLALRIVPLFVKKSCVKFFSFLKSSTTILSNIGVIELENRYKMHIDNILILVMPNPIQKIKCSVCSFDDKLNVTINSIINDLYFEKTFYNVLSEQLKNIELISNDDRRSNYVSSKDKKRKN